jgi:hypothetical protein
MSKISYHEKNQENERVRSFIKSKKQRNFPYQSMENFVKQ